MPDRFDIHNPILKESAPGYDSTSQEILVGDFDLSLLEESLHLSPWERMLANDDALNFGESLRTSMKSRYAKP